MMIRRAVQEQKRLGDESEPLLDLPSSRMTRGYSETPGT
jgi:hypothetical protein